MAVRLVSTARHRALNECLLGADPADRVLLTYYHEPMELAPGNGKVALGTDKLVLPGATSPSAHPGSGCAPSHMPLRCDKTLLALLLSCGSLSREHAAFAAHAITTKLESTRVLYLHSTPKLSRVGLPFTSSFSYNSTAI
jgi:hypothetical protein